MQWVQTTGRSIEEAKARALDQLGVGEDEAEFEVVAEPKTGLFGRHKADAHVRARVRPTAVRPKLERRDRRRGRDRDGAPDSRGPRGERGERGRRGERRDGAGRGANSDAAHSPAATEGDTVSAARTGQAAAAGTDHALAVTDTRAPRGDRSPRSKQRPRKSGAPNQHEESDVSAEQVAEEASKFLKDLVSAFGLSGEVSSREDGDDIEVAVDGADLGLLVGPRGNTLLAIQDLTRVASQRRLGDHETRLRVDVGGYRVRRREALSRFAVQVAEQVIASGEARALEPMPSADRKVIHDALNDLDGVVTRSEGDDQQRRVVIAPAAD